MNTPDFKKALEKAAQAARKHAHRHGEPYAIMEDGKVKRVYKSGRVVTVAVRRAKKLS